MDWEGCFTVFRYQEHAPDRQVFLIAQQKNHFYTNYNTGMKIARELEKAASTIAAIPIVEMGALLNRINELR